MILSPLTTVWVRKSGFIRSKTHFSDGFRRGQCDFRVFVRSKTPIHVNRNPCLLISDFILPIPLPNLIKSIMLQAGFSKPLQGIQHKYFIQYVTIFGFDESLLLNSRVGVFQRRGRCNSITVKPTAYQKWVVPVINRENYDKSRRSKGNREWRIQGGP